MYLKWASHLSLSIQNFLSPKRNIFFGSGVGGSQGRSMTPPPSPLPPLLSKRLLAGCCCIFRTTAPVAQVRAEQVRVQWV